MKEKIEKHVAEAFESQMEALEALVNQPSHTYAKEDVEAAAKILDEICAEKGLSVEPVPATDPQFADHRVYRSQDFDPDSPCVALIGHVDTVFPRSSGFLKFDRNEERAFGPGVLDMKSGLLTILWAIEAVDAIGKRPPLQFICVSDEEVGSPSSRDLYDSLAGTISEALVFEKGRTEDRIITSRKGGGSFIIEAHGVAAHAGNHHEKGRNAVHALASLVPKLEAHTNYEQGVTINVGLFEGGTAKNTVPDYARCVIDARFITVEDAKKFEGQIAALVAEPLPGRLSDVRFELSGGITRPPMEATAGNKALAERYGKCAVEAGLKDGEAPRQGGFSDSNLIAPHGIPVIDGLGAYGEGAHSHNEWCDLDSLRRRTVALALYLASSS